MPLFPCPECGGQVSDAATACPHCGFPLSPPAPAPAPAEVPATDADRALAAQVAEQVRAALAGGGESVRTGVGGYTAAETQRMADNMLAQVRAALGTVGLSDGGTTVTRGGPFVISTPTTNTGSLPASASGPQPGYTSRPVGSGYGYDYRSKWTLFGLPLLAMSQGYNPTTGRKRVAKGVVAIGDVAVGFLAIGGAAFGGVCLGGLSVGLISLGGLAVGGLLAVGGAAIGTVAFGGLAIGGWALGRGAYGWHTLGPTAMRP